jgi:replicative DNA helicase
MPLNAQTTAEQAVAPFDIEMEMSLLGCLLHDNQVLGDALEFVDKTSFYTTAHQVIFEVMTGLFDERKAFDLLLLREELKKKGLLERAGGAEYLGSLFISVASAANAAQYAKVIKDKATLRNLIDTCNNVLTQASQVSANPDELLDRAEQSVFDVARKRTSAKSMKISDILRDTIDHIYESRSREGRITGLSTGFLDLDDLITGFHPGQLVIVAGRPGMGKTSLALRMLEHIAIEQKKPAVLFSLEMAGEEITRNMLCSYARVSAHALRTGKISEADINKLLLAAGSFDEAPIWIDDSSGLAPLEIKARSRRLKASDNIQAIFVDYMQLMEVKGRNPESRQVEVAMISRALKGLAKELEVPVIAVSQLSREVEKRESHRPQMADLRESGAIEQDADVIVMLYRDEVYNRTPQNEGICDVIVTKQRNGPTGTVKLAFLKDYMRFENAVLAPKGGEAGA